MSLTQRERMLLSGLLTTCILFLGFVFLMKPQFARFRYLTSSNSTLSSNTSKLAEKETQLNQELARYRILSEDTRKQIAFTFEERDLEERMKGFIKALSDLSVETGNQLVAIRPYNTEGTSNRAMASRTGEGLDDALDIPETLRHFSVVKEPGIPLYSTEIDLQIRGSYPQVKQFVEALIGVKNELVKIETMYLSYEALENRTLMPGGRGSARRRRGASTLNLGSQNMDQPLLMSSRLKFYLLEPGVQKFEHFDKPAKAAKKESSKTTEEKA